MNEKNPRYRRIKPYSFTKPSFFAKSIVYVTVGRMCRYVDNGVRRPVIASSVIDFAALDEDTEAACMQNHTPGGPAIPSSSRNKLQVTPLSALE